MSGIENNVSNCESKFELNWPITSDFVFLTLWIFFFGPESGQWCLQETVSQTERGATKSDVL